MRNLHRCHTLRLNALNSISVGAPPQIPLGELTTLLHADSLAASKGPTYRGRGSGRDGKFAPALLISPGCRGARIFSAILPLNCIRLHRHCPVGDSASKPLSSPTDNLCIHHLHSCDTTHDYHHRRSFRGPWGRSPPNAGSWTIFYRASICEGGLGSRNSVCPSVRLSHAWIVTKLNDALQIFYTTRKGNHSATVIPRVVGGRRPLPSEICVQNDPPLRKTPTSTDFRS